MLGDCGCVLDWENFNCEFAVLTSNSRSQSKLIFHVVFDNYFE